VAEKLYNKLSKELIDESISDYASSASSLLPLLPSPSNEEEQMPALPKTNKTV
jgi:hypothetical protein